MRAIWSGSISFGLIHIPVKLYSGSEERALNLDMLEKGSHKPIGYQTVIKSSGTPVKRENIVKGYKFSRNKYIVLEDQDFEAAAPDKTRNIELQAFVERTEIDPLYFEKPYYLEPDEKAGKPYALLREALQRSGKVAVARYVLREKQYVGIVQPEGKALILVQMRYAENVRSMEELDLPTDLKLQPQEIKMAIALIDQLTESFDPKAYTDTYKAELLKMIEAKAKGKKIAHVAKAERPVTDDSDDLTSILKQSLEGGRKRPATAASRRPAAAKRASKRAPSGASRKSASKRSGAK